MRSRRVVAVVGGVGLGVIALVAVLVGRAELAPDLQPQVEPVDVAVDADATARRLSALIQLETISSHEPGAADPAPFQALNAWLPTAFPDLHRVTQVETFGLARLYRWPGADPSLPPVMLMAHTDVVPVETPDAWTHPPFSGRIVDGHVWGRGAIDMKAALIGFMQAADALAAEGWQPPRTVYMALGHDEEVGGHQGHRRIAAALAERGERLSWVLDEGLVITDGIVPGLDAPGALVGVAEKGYLTVELVVQGTGGHSSMPPTQTAAGVVAAAAARVEAAPFEGGVDGPVAGMFAWLGPQMRYPERLAFANLWLLAPVVASQLEAQPNTNATLRTTIAVTQLQGSSQENVLPQQARAVINLRLHPRDTIDGALARLEAVIDDPRVELRPVETSLYSEPSPVSATDGPGFRAIATAVRQVHPDAVVAPGLMVGGTDSRWYQPVADDIYRFQPAWLGPGDTDRIHGVDERIAVENLADYVRFYRQVLVNL